ncbi:glycosyltransferase family 2 protein [Lactobacillus sp.]|uniref:glycosyltransferase family 2 protein n=1 Tax=Lactobacillus sp. TaxID=1591 RepID=UPI003EF377BB
MSKVLSISVAAYNAADCLDKCIASLTNNAVLDKLEIIIVNDGSKDNTAELGRKYQAQFPDSVVFIDKENGGHGSTINASLKVATGKYYKIVDSDDWVEKAGIEQLVQALEKSDADLVLNSFYTVDEQSGEKTFKSVFDGAAPKNAKTLADIKDSYNPVMHGSTFKTELLRKCHLKIDEHCFYVDNEMMLYPLPYIETVEVLDFPVYDYLLGSVNQSVNMKNMIKNRAQHVQVIEKVSKYYTDQVTDPAVREIYLRLLQKIVNKQYQIFFIMDAQKAKPELLAFENYLEKEAPEIYRQVPAMTGRKGQVISFNRKTGYKLYGLTLALLKPLMK